MMGGGGGTEIMKSGTLDLREVRARTTLREVRLKGHHYVELRRVGKRIIFFCNLCLSPCYSDSVLFDHLNGNLHARRYASAKVTLFGPVPWPFGDGALFFNASSSEKEENFPVLGSENGRGLCLSTRNAKIRPVVDGDEVGEVTSRIRLHSESMVSNSSDNSFSDRRNGNHSIANQEGKNCNVACVGAVEHLCKDCSRSKGNAGSTLIIPGVLLKEEVSSLSAHLLGFGQIAARIRETDEHRVKIDKIWCAWLGQVNSDHTHESLASQRCDFAIVCFSYTHDLGRKNALDDLNSPISSNSFFEIDGLGRLVKKQRKSFSDPEDSSDSLTNHSIPCGRTVEAPDQLRTSRSFSSKAARRELRKRKHIASDKLCDICAQPMLQGKDVATLLNCKTGNLACSSRNTNGAFHIFHVSCLLHWVLLCEFEIWTNQLSNIKPTRGRKGKGAQSKHITSAFCPECQGTGRFFKGDDLEKPTIPLSEMFLFKLKAIEAQKAWMKNPEVLKKCSTGLHFSCNLEENIQDSSVSQEKVLPIKSLRFYQADA